MKAFNKVRIDKLFEILQNQYIPNLLLKTQRNLLGNKIKINSKLSDK